MSFWYVAKAHAARSAVHPLVHGQLAHHEALQGLRRALRVARTTERGTRVTTRVLQHYIRTTGMLQINKLHKYMHSRL